MAKLIFLEAPAAYESFDWQAHRAGTAVVWDVLRATSTIVTAFHSGIKAILPVREVEEAFAAKQESRLLAGERGGVAVAGFDRGNSPREFLGPELRGKHMVLSTTNGTRALRAAAACERVAVGSLLNLQAVADWLQRQPAPWILACSGTGEDFALEDALAAALLAERLGVDTPWRPLASAWGSSVEEAFRRSRNGRRLQSLGLGEDVAWCARQDVLDEVPLLQADGWLRL
jgi:2-phosphosulfolactate phosphatase